MLMSAQRKLDAETKRFDTTMKAKLAESDEMRAVLVKTQKELERSKREGQGMREEVCLPSAERGRSDCSAGHVCHGRSAESPACFGAGTAADCGAGTPAGSG